MQSQCHKAKNFTPGKEAQSTKVAAAVQEVQNALPRARVVYCSATGVSEVGNMAFMTRLVRPRALLHDLSHDLPAHAWPEITSFV